MSKNRSGICLIILFLFALTSCSISMEKRRYRPGYHIDMVTTKRQMNTNRDREDLVKETATDPVIVVSEPSKEVINGELMKVETSITKKNTIPKNPIKKRRAKNPLLDSCDVIFTAVGERIEARVIEITDDYVHYKMCDDPKGRLYSIKTKMIDNITLRNGELFIPKDRVIVDKEKLRKKSQTLFTASVISLCFAFVGFVFSFFINPFSTISLVLLVLSGIFSFILALMDVKPGRYTPSYMTKLTWIFYLLVLMLVIAGLILIFI